MQQVMEEYRVIDGTSMFGFRPSDVVMLDDSAGRFGKAEVEQAAGKLVRYFQIRNCWHPFTITELFNFYNINY